MVAPAPDALFLLWGLLLISTGIVGLLTELWDA